MAAAIAQTATGCFADLLLTTLPIIFLRKVKLCRKRKILIFATFSASTVINVVTIVQATYLFNKSAPTAAVIVAYVKTGLAVIVCNLLVIVTFIYRVLHKDQMDLDAPNSTAIEFTTVDLSLEGWSAETSKGASIPARSCSTTRSSTWSYRPMGSLASKLSSVVAGTSRVDTLQSDVIIEEER
ncbi:hypothetical protein JVU11DRAFT_7954 [Chiua virens]|nr:hypothetical protein JVU11DRAFT_7954 [Chiua virens]